MKLNLLSVFCLFLLSACSKKTDTSTEPEMADFAPHSNNIYLNEDVSVVVFASSTVPDASWDFGDGSPVVVGKQPPHIYTKSGVYTITRKIGNTTQSHKVRVYPGEGSFQIKSSLKSITYTTYAYFKAGGEDIPEYYNFKNLGLNEITDTLYYNRPAGLTYDPGLNVRFTFVNPYLTSVSFTAKFFPESRRHTLLEIVGDTQGKYTYKSLNNYYTTTGRISDAMGAR